MRVLELWAWRLRRRREILITMREWSGLKERGKLHRLWKRCESAVKDEGAWARELDHD